MSQGLRFDAAPSGDSAAGSAGGPLLARSAVLRLRPKTLHGARGFSARPRAIVPARSRAGRARRRTAAKASRTERTQPGIASAVTTGADAVLKGVRTQSGVADSGLPP